MAARTGDEQPGTAEPFAFRRSPLLWAALALVVVGLAVFGIQWQRPLLPLLVDWLPGSAAAALATAACIRTARARHVAGPARRFWGHLGVTMALIVVAVFSNMYDALAGAGAPTQRTSWLTMGLYVAGVLVLAYGLVRLPVRRRSTNDLLTFGLDIAIVMASAGLIAWHLTPLGVAQIRAATGSGWGMSGIVLLGFAGLLAVVKVALTGTGPIDRGSLWTLGGTLLAGVVGGSMAPLLISRQYLNDNHLVLPVCSLGVIIAAELQRGPRTARGAPPSRRRRRFSYLPYLAIAVTDGVVIHGAGMGGGPTRTLVVGSVVLTGLVIARQLISFYENASLLAQVDASMLELRRHERRFRSLVQNSSDIIAITDVDGALTYASPGLTKILGIPLESLLGAPVDQLLHPDDAAGIASRTGVRRTPGEAITSHVRVRHRDGGWRWLEVLSTNLLHDPSVRGIVNNARDVTENRRIQEQLAHQASHDALTGLANRTLFAERTAAAVEANDQPDRLAIALVDLDDFKSINDRLGHGVGDALLVAVAERLRNCVRPDDLVARLGGDEFALLLGGVAAGEAAGIAERIIDALGVPFRAAGYELLVQASIGLAHQSTITAADDLLRRADVAMYAAKELGKSRFVEYRPELDAHAVEHARLAAELSQALDRGEMRVVYQPIVGLPHGDLRGVEALVRWVNPDRGTVSPVSFIPVAERTGLIVPLGAWILREACHQGAAWHRAYGSAAPEKISVNVSARQLLDPTFSATVVDALEVSGLKPAQLTIEITETAVFGGGRALDTVRAIHDLGVKIALDDFGTGHSSLGLLRTCPVDVLKVDKSFVDGVPGTSEQEAIVTSISEIAQALRLEAVAEGVETAAQAERLHALGYQLAQGYHFSRPVPPDRIDAMCEPAPVVTAAP